MDKNANKSPRQRRSIRDISLPKKDEAMADASSMQNNGIAISYEAPAEGSDKAERMNRPIPSRRTKHLVIENEDESHAPAAAQPQTYAGTADGMAEMGTYKPDLENAEMEPLATIDSASDEDMDTPPAKPAPKPRTRSRQNWQDHVEKAFMSSDDVETDAIARRKAAGTDPDDIGNTSKTSHFAPLKSSRRKAGRRARAVLVTVIALAVIFGLMQTVFARVVINIPKGTTSMSFADQQLVAEVQSSGITKNSEKKIAIGAVKNVTVNTKATGTIILYNNYSTQPYDLIKTTRVQTANGSVYRLTQDVTIPGKKGSTPGTVNAKVEAEKPGSEYNAKGGTSLNLPGLIAGTEKYKQIYAKVSANFTGGASGSAPDLASAGITPAIDAAKEGVKTEFLAQVAAENPDLVILPDSVTVVTSYDSTKIPAPSTTGPNAGKSEITVKFTTKAVGLKRDSLKAALEATTASKGTATNFSNEVLDVLNYTVVETPDDSVASGMFQVKASGTVEGAFTDALQEKLKEDLAGKPLGSAKALVDEKFTGQDVDVKAWPFWMKTVPNDTSKIKVEVGTK